MGITDLVGPVGVASILLEEDPGLVVAVKDKDWETGEDALNHVDLPVSGDGIDRSAPVALTCRESYLAAPTSFVFRMVGEKKNPF